MRLINRAFGFLAAGAGLVLAGWGPWAFEVLSGHALPAPVATDQVAMTAWSGVAFTRVFGAVLFGLGAVLWTANAKSPRPHTTQIALFAGCVLASLITWSQQVAIWSNAIGWALVALFAALSVTTGLSLVQTRRHTTSTAAA